MSAFAPEDRRWMRRALRLAVRGKRSSAPNPAVGCVLVKNGQIVGEGFHARAGEAHAEVLALAMAGKAAKGATAYVTLEPCSHHGRTPPCTDALIAAGIMRVIAATRDPNPRVNGAGLERLLAAQVETQEGLYINQIQELNRGFFSRFKNDRPWLTLKIATSLDGKSALADGRSQWITGPLARAAVQRGRARSGAVLTGIGSVLADNPALNVRLPGTTRQPLRVVLDSSLRTPPDARLLGADGGAVHIFCSVVSPARQATLQAAGANVHVLKATEQGTVNIEAALHELAVLQVNDVYAECGPTLAGALMAAKVVDELDLFIGAHLLGATARPLALLDEVSAIPDPPRWRTVAAQRVGRDTRVRLQPWLD